MVKTNQDTINPKDLLGAKKTPISLLPIEGVKQGALAMKHGADKYGPYNWRDKKVQTLIYIDAILRHTYEYLEGYDKDKDSGLHPLAHVVANGCLLLDAIKYNCVLDNRPGIGAYVEYNTDVVVGGGSGKTTKVEEEINKCITCGHGKTTQAHKLLCPTTGVL